MYVWFIEHHTNQRHAASGVQSKDLEFVSCALVRTFYEGSSINRLLNIQRKYRYSV